MRCISSLEFSLHLCGVFYQSWCPNLVTKALAFLWCTFLPHLEVIDLLEMQLSILNKSDMKSWSLWSYWQNSSPRFIKIFNLSVVSNQWWWKKLVSWSTQRAFGHSKFSKTLKWPAPRSEQDFELQVKGSSLTINLSHQSATLRNS